MNRIRIERNIDGYTIKAEARYLPESVGWVCRVSEGAHGPTIEKRGPDETGNDAWLTLIDMIELALKTMRQRNAMIAGPFSSTQSQ